MSTNEEIVAAIQAGDTSLFESLWNRVRALACKMANRFHFASQGRGGLEIEDLEQIGFLAMIDAAESYDPQREAAFATWYCIMLRKYFQDAAGRSYSDRHGQQRARDSLDYAISLNTPVGDEADGCELGEIIADPKSMTDAVEHKIWLQELRELVGNLLQDLPPVQRETLYRRFWENLTYTAAGEELGVAGQTVRTNEARAIKAIRHSKHMAQLRPFYDFNCYCGTGLSAFLSSGASVQERYIFREEDRQERALGGQRAKQQTAMHR